jgi:hypothetical protein
MYTFRLAALGGLAFLAGACTPTWDTSWKTAALARDPMVYGPYLIGADRPSVGIGCVRPGAVRSQDARAIWRPCKTEILLPPPSTPVVSIEPLPPAGSYVIPEGRVERGPPPGSAPYRGPSRSRSAWDG